MKVKEEEEEEDKDMTTTTATTNDDAHCVEYDCGTSVKYVDDSHVYKINGHQDEVVSVTALISYYFPAFDPDQVATKMASQPYWGSVCRGANSRYHGADSAEKIKAVWEKERDAGTKLHLQIEQWITANHRPTSDQLRRLAHIKRLHNPVAKLPPLRSEDIIEEMSTFMNKTNLETIYNLVNAHLGTAPSACLFLTEMPICDEEAMIGGCPDLVVVAPDGKAVLFDWKSSRWPLDTKYDAERKGFGPCAHLTGGKTTTYSLQLNMYKHMLRKCSQIEVVAMYLVVINKKNVFKIVKVESMTKEVEYMIEARKQQQHPSQSRNNVIDVAAASS